MSFNESFRRHILPKYGEPQYANDYNILSEDGNMPSPMSIHPVDRRDFTNLPCYTIDPAGSTDADDGFSIWASPANTAYYLAVHIADPTDSFAPTSQLFDKICQSGQTHYPSGHPTRHMMPPTLVEEASLIGGVNRRAISVVTQIDPNTFLPVGQVEIVASLVHCDATYRWSYEQAAQEQIWNLNLQTGLTIAQALRTARKAVGQKLAELSQVVPKTSQDGSQVDLVCDSTEVMAMKGMIAEFAIFANSAVAQFLNLKFPGLGIFRVCEAQVLTDSQSRQLSAQQLMKEIIQNGLSAEYLAKLDPHDLVGLPAYCHFTSPLRRATDCVCHFLVKAALVGQPAPFTQAELETLAGRLDSIAKRERQIQHADRKLRIMQALSQLVSDEGQVIIRARFNGFTGLFLNIMIEQIGHLTVSVSYTLRVPNWSRLSEFTGTGDDEEYRWIRVRTVNPPGGYDQGTLPELDQAFM